MEKLEKIDIKKHSKYFFIASFLIIITISVFLIWPFLTAIMGSVILAYIFYPLYIRLLSVLKNKNITALLMSLLVLVIFLLPILFTVSTIANESKDIFFMIRNLDISLKSENFLSNYLNVESTNIDFSGYIRNYLNKISLTILEKTDEFILDLPNKLIAFFVMFFVMFYLFKDGENLIERIKYEIPLKENYKDNLVKKFDETIYATIYGLILTAFIQGAVGALGLYIFDVSSPVLWGMVMIILAMLPYLGTTFVWLPASVIKLISGDTFNGIGLFLFGLIIVSSIDNIIRAKIIEMKGKIHPVFALLGVLGGLKIFGLIGIIIGPLTLAILVVFFELYIMEKKERRKRRKY